MKYVLFVCSHNAGRSQMAQAFFERRGPDDVRAESAGQQPRKEGLWPNVVEAMREVGLDLADRRPKKLTVDAVLARYHDAPVRSLVMALAHRDARELLRAGTLASTP